MNNIFADRNRQASSNYGIGSDGRVGLYVDEANRSWCSSNGDNDHQAVTIEVANDVIGGNWHVSDVALAKLIDLCVDICERNHIDRLIFTGNASGNLTLHKYFAATACPGPYLESKMPYIAEEVNRRLNIKDNKPGTSAYIVKEGDTLSAIARIYNTTYQVLAEYNGISNPDLIYPGQVINIPQTNSNKLKIGDTVRIINTGNGSSNGDSNIAYGIGWTRTILNIYEGRAFPYQVGDSTGTTGFYKETSLEKL